SNTLNYDKYQKRESYVVYHVPNTTSNYYIIRENINGTINCSSNALFTFNVTTVYNNIISRTGENFLFVTVYWLTTIVAVLISIFDIVLTIVDHYTQHDDIYESVEEETSRGTKTISSIGSQLLQKGSFLFPTYFIGIFDYTQLCLSHHTKESLFILHHTYIGIGITLGSTIYLILWTLACWDSRRHGYGKVILLCLTVIPLGVYGIFVWITSLMEFILTTKAVLISFNFILEINESTTRTLLIRLEELHVPLMVLQRTGIGKTVNELRRTITNENLATMTKNLLKNWKKLLPNSSVKDNKSTTSQSTISNSNVPWYTTDNARLKSRELLVNALSINGIPEGSNDPEELCARIEDAIFKELKDTKIQYGR
ncbi:unnamed protein product, partial [Adineta steineri]